MMSHERLAHKIIDLIAHGHYSLQDMNHTGFHVINLAHRQVRMNAITLADSILYHDAFPYHEGVEYEQHTLF